MKRKLFLLAFLILIFSIEFSSCSPSTQEKIWEEVAIPGKKYTLKLQTKFYNNKLLYILQLTPYGDNATKFADTITVDLADTNGFVLETIKPETWTKTVNDEGEPIMVTSSGNIGIEIKNYNEIYTWSPKWRN